MMKMLSTEQVAAAYAILRDRGLTHAERNAMRAWGRWALRSDDWTFELRTDQVEIAAYTKELRGSPDDALGDAVRLREELLAALERKDGRGFVAAEAANTDDIVIVGWVGAVRLVVDLEVG